MIEKKKLIVTSLEKNCSIKKKGVDAKFVDWTLKFVEIWKVNPIGDGTCLENS